MVGPYSRRLGIVVTWGIAMLFIPGEIVMRILSKRQLKELVSYSPQHIARLEKAGKFPKRGHLGGNRVGWVEDEALRWLQERLDCREAPPRGTRASVISHQLTSTSDVDRPFYWKGTGFNKTQSIKDACNTKTKLPKIPKQRSQSIR